MSPDPKDHANDDDQNLLTLEGIGWSNFKQVNGSVLEV